MLRLSTFAVSTLTPALNVRSTTFPDSTALSLVRTNAGPLPGLTCWNSTTVHSWPSMLSTRPFLRSFVVATEGLLVGCLEDEQIAGRRGERHGPTGPDHEGVLDADPAAPGEIDPRLDSHRRAVAQDTCRGVADHRRLVDVEADAVPETVPEV